MEKGIKEKFSRAFNDYAPQIMRHIYFKVNNADLAQDMLQEAFFRAWRYAVGAEEKKIEDMKKFLFMAANNIVIDHYRNKDKRPISMEDVSDKSAFLLNAGQEEAADRKIKKEIIIKKLSEIDGNYRQIMVYYFFNEYSIGEISRITKKSPNNVSVIIHRGIKKLREKISAAGILNC